MVLLLAVLGVGISCVTYSLVVTLGVGRASYRADKRTAAPVAHGAAVNTSGGRERKPMCERKRRGMQIRGIETKRTTGVTAVCSVRVCATPRFWWPQTCASHDATRPRPNVLGGARRGANQTEDLGRNASAVRPRTVLVPASSAAAAKHCCTATRNTNADDNQSSAPERLQKRGEFSSKRRVCLAYRPRGAWYALIV